MSGDGRKQLHDAVLTALTAALGSTPVYDHIPQGTNFPYVLIGDNDTEEFDTDTEHGQEHRVMVHAFSRKRGKDELRTLMKQIYDALHQVSLSLASGAALVHIHWEFSDIVSEPDDNNTTLHGVQRFRALTTEA